MVICLIGTRAQLIKMAPVLRRLEASAVPCRLILSGQHQETMQALLQEFGIGLPPLRMGEGPEITRVGPLLRWFLRMLWQGLVPRRAWFRPEPAAPACMVVHGDTVSTLLGALLGRWHGLSVVHVESGLSSGRWREPFPEELIRRLVFRLTDLAFCPGPVATARLAGRRLRRVDTGANTILDAVRLARERFAGVTAPVPSTPYGVVSLHRFENIFDAARFGALLDALEQAAALLPLVFVLHPSTRRQAERLGLMGRLSSMPGLTLLPRMTYVPFLKLASGARCVVTDGGSNQEELAYLGIPTLLMRRVTERDDGLGATVALAGDAPHALAAFVRRVLEATPSALVATEADGEDSPARRIATLLAAEFGPQPMRLAD